MKTHDIRSKYLQFFEGKDHLVLPSSSLVPKDDPSLLLIGAGMAPLKKYFTGESMPPHPRIATCQKCMRTPDIDRVGKTARHCTFFEMLGNFSFGDYFKKEAIEWAWEFVTEILKLPTDKLWVTVYFEDDEAFAVWNEHIGIPAEKIVRLGKEDNFWEIGTGPCGPCSEIYIDRGESFGCGKEGCAPGCDCDRFLEFWNLVFTQFDRDENGEYHLLEKKNIDTGMGLERIAAIMQDVPNVFEIDIIRPILDRVSELVCAEYGSSQRVDTAIRVITEHARGVTFMIADGVLPSNEGRGYVLRRLLRRAVRYGRLMGINHAFMPEVAGKVIDVMEEAYPDLGEKREFILRIVTGEEERFHATLNQGLEILQRIMHERSDQIIPGIEVFRLYDTFGFPIELTEEIAAESGFTIDMDGFRSEMEKQRERAREARQSDRGFALDKEINQRLNQLPETHFVGYDKLQSQSKIQTIIKDGKFVDHAEEGDQVIVVTEDTPFYPEGGGQVGDTGVLTQETGEGTVIDTKRIMDRYIEHFVAIRAGTIYAGKSVLMKVDEDRRIKIARNHSATHLLHKALRTVLGDHAKQSGSLVSDEFLRFDVSHYEAITDTELRSIERIVNREILQNHAIIIREIAYEDAKKQGILALFEGKYGDNVRVVKTGDVCEELCGGTHVQASGQIGIMKIMSESSVGAGLRRIEAVTGTKALEYVEKNEDTLQKISDIVNANPDDLVNRVEEIVAKGQTADRELEKFKKQAMKARVALLIEEAEKIGEILVVSGHLGNGSIEDLRSAIDFIKESSVDAVTLLGGEKDGHAHLLVSVPKKYIEYGIHAGKLIKEMSSLVSGGGGGRPDLAQAGGKNPAGISDALLAGKEALKNVKKNQ